MMTEPSVLVVFIIKVIVLIKSSPFVRSVCLHDVLTFYNEGNDGACKFKKDIFTNVFIDNAKRCQVNCYVDSLHPSYEDMDVNIWYEIERLQINFSSTTYTFILEKPCSKIPSTDLYVTVHCEGKYIQDRGIGESCISDNQCVNVNANSTCDETTRLCQCKTGHLYLWENKTCSPVQELGELCYDSRQCKWVNPYSMCNNENKCECQHGYVKLNNSCMPERRLNETCDDDIQCSMVTTNSTCNTATRVCTCKDGNLEMMNMCVYVDKWYYLLSIENLADKNVEQICSMYSETFLSTSTSEEVDNNSSYGLVIGVGIAGLVFGIAMCGAVYFIMIRHRTKSQSRTNEVKEETNQSRSVEVSNAVYSKPIHHKDKRCDTGIAVENAIYNHLHEDPSEVCIQADYDHVPQLGSIDDDYSHLATCNSTDVGTPGEYGVFN